MFSNFNYKNLQCCSQKFYSRFFRFWFQPKLVIWPKGFPLFASELNHVISLSVTKNYSFKIYLYINIIFQQQCAQSKTGKNVIISLLSNASALTLLSQRVNEKTYEQLQSGLHLPAEKLLATDHFQRYRGLLQQSVGQSVLTKSTHKMATKSNNTSVIRPCRCFHQVLANWTLKNQRLKPSINLSQIIQTIKSRI